MTAANILNQLGLLLDFAAFWLASPEILGEDRLARYESVIERKLIEPLRSIGDRAIDVIVWFTFLLPLIVSIGTFISLVVALVALIFPSLGVTGTVSFNIYAISFCGTAALWLATILLLPRLTRSIAVAAQNLLRHLRDDASLRQRWLRYGAIAFSLGFALQFVSGFLN